MLLRTNDWERFQACHQLVFLILRCSRMVIRQESVTKDGHIKFAGVEFLEYGLCEALVIVQDGDFDWTCHYAFAILSLLS